MKAFLLLQILDNPTNDFSIGRGRGQGDLEGQGGGQDQAGHRRERGGRQDQGSTLQVRFIILSPKILFEFPKKITHAGGGSIGRQLGYSSLCLGFLSRGCPRFLKEGWTLTLLALNKSINLAPKTVKELTWPPKFVFVMLSAWLVTYIVTSSSHLICLFYFKCPHLYLLTLIGATIFLTHSDLLILE